MKPKVSVLMPVFNGSAYLDDAIKSILSQNYNDFEFIIIDDASTDDSKEIIKSYSDSRINLIVNSSNLGLTKSLNIGLREASGEFIARMDADDFSYPQRIHNQILFLEKHQDVILCGSWGKIISGEQDTDEIWAHPTKNDDILISFLFHNPFIHASVMFRSDLFRKHGLFYNEKLKAAQDYDYFTRASSHGELANIPEVLINYRVHESSVQKTLSEDQRHNSNKIRSWQLKKYSIPNTETELDMHNCMATNSKRIGVYTLTGITSWLNKVYEVVSRHYQSDTINLMFLNYYSTSSINIKSPIIEKISGPIRLKVKKPHFYYLKHLVKEILRYISVRHA